MDKREKIKRSYDHYKRQITHWEVAILKTTGRKPDKNDLYDAPAHVQIAYKEYKKIKKYLESHSLEEESIRAENDKEQKQKTPKKIFFTCQVNPPRSVETAFPDVANEVYKKLSSKLFMASSLSNSKWDKPFLGKLSGKQANESSEPVGNILVSEASIARTSSNIFSVTTDEDGGQDCVDGDGSSVKQGECVIPVMPNNTYDRISAVWQNPSLEMKASKLSHGKCNVEKIKQVDQSWLKRCGADLENNIDEDASDDVSSVIVTRNGAYGREFSPSPEKQPKSSLLLNAPTEIETPDLIAIDPCSGDQEKQVDQRWMGRCSADVSNTSNNSNKDASYDVSNVIVTRKRSSTQAFSPSPEKPKPKRKFFKTTREEREKYRVLSQVKKPVSGVSEESKILPEKLTQSVIKMAPEKVSQSIVKIVPGKVSQPISAVNHDVASPTSTTEKDVDLTVTKKHPKKSKLNVKKKNKIIGTSKSKATKAVKGKILPEPNKIDNNAMPAPAPSGKGDDTYDEVIQTSNRNPRKSFTKMSKEQLLERKVNDGKVNQNFVRIDVTKKVFVRGHKKISGAKVKRMNWKSKQSAAFKATKSATLTCRKCGESGHFAKFCTTGLSSNEKQEPEQIDDSPFPTLEEAAQMAISKTASNVFSTKVYENSAQSTSTDTVLNEDVEVPSKESESEFDFAEQSKLSNPQSNVVESYFTEQCSSDKQDILLKKTLNIFGYDEFRDGQKEAIIRVLNGLSTLVILSTGSGKSLCYQLPAYLYSKKHPGVLTLCISPLVSLMEDQVQGVPSFFNAACLHNNMSTKQKEVVIEKLKSRKLEVLLVSPEAICGGLFGLLKTGNIPPIGFACIDEVHCVSQWSHNFRPSYLQICKILREKLNVKTILGLTATATEQTASSICEHLKIDPSTTIRGELIPRNLNLSVSRDKDREDALLTLLKGDRFKECDSIIIYCTRREECENISKLIRINLQEGALNGKTKLKPRQRISNNCEAYHAGMTPTRRRMVQRLFMNGEIRIVVATVAFGMGIDKSDIRAVIHFNMPKTFESYVQEIGRAGRDSLPAHCHLFLDNVKGRDLCELKRHVFSNSVDRPTLRKLIGRIFRPCKCSRIAAITGENKENKNKENNENNRCPGHEVSFSVNDTIMELDLPSENIMTLLCYLELDEQRKWIELLPMTYELCKIQSYGGTQLLKSAAQNCPPLGVAIALKREKKKFKEKDTYLEFNVIETAATVGWNSAVVKRELKNLEWKATEFDEQGKGKKFRKSGIMVEFSELAFRVVAPGDITDEEADVILDSLHKINLGQEKTQLRQLNRVYQSLFSVSSSNVGDCCDGYISERSDRLKDFIHDYFQQSKLELPEEGLNEPPQGSEKEEEVRRDARNLMFSSQDIKFSGRAIAKIFHGISSPCFPAEQWGRNRSFWRRYLNVDFNLLCQIAGQEVMMYQ